MSFLEKLFPKKPLPGRVGDDDGFLDIDLPLVSLVVGASGEYRAIARGLIESVDMGFAVSLQPEWRAKPVERGDVTFYWGIGAYESTGVNSDAFVRFVARRYNLPVNTGTLRMLPRVPAEVVGLGSNPVQVRELGAKMKFFFHSSSEERYAEVFTNVNVAEAVLEFHEKDNEYRTSLLRAFTEA